MTSGHLGNYTSLTDVTLTSGITLTLINEAAIKVSILPLVAIGPDCDEKEIELLFRNRQYELG